MAKHLNFVERGVLYRLRMEGKGQAEIAESWGGIRAPFAENCSGIQVGAVIALNKLNAKRTNGDCNAAVHARWMILA